MHHGSEEIGNSQGSWARWWVLRLLIGASLLWDGRETGRYCGDYGTETLAWEPVSYPRLRRGLLHFHSDQRGPVGTSNVGGFLQVVIILVQVTTLLEVLRPSVPWESRGPGCVVQGGLRDNSRGLRSEGDSGSTGEGECDET